MRIRRAGVLLAGLVVALAGAVPAAAGLPIGYLDHSGDTGLHWILDSPGPDPELPAVTCLYGTTDQRLKLMRVRQPVMFANSPTYRTQSVWWRIKVEHAAAIEGPWELGTTSPWRKAAAKAPNPADLAPTTVGFGASVLDHPLHRIVYELRWNQGTGTTQVGSAQHTPVWYRIDSALGTGTTQNGCPNSLAPLVAGFTVDNGEDAHSGKRGPHWLLDNPGPNPELTAAICEYDALGQLDRIVIRRPMVLARDTGPGIQAQDVAWKVVVQASVTNSGTEQWGSTVGQTTTTRRRATEQAWADFRPKVVDPSAIEGFEVVRVLSKLTWFKGTSNTVAGRASHHPMTYRLEYHNGNYGWHQDYCYMTLDL